METKFKSYIYQGDSQDSIMEIEGQLQLKVGDKFYYSFRGLSPRTEATLRESLSEFKPEFVQSYVDNIKAKAKEFHIKHYVVKRIGRSYIVNNGMNHLIYDKGFNEITYEYFVEDIDEYWYMKLYWWFSRLRTRIKYYGK